MKYLILIVSLILLCIHFFLFYTTPDIIVLIGVILFAATALSFKRDARYLIVAGIIFLAITPFCLIIKSQNFAEKNVTAAYMLFIATVILSLKELLIHGKK